MSNPIQARSHSLPGKGSFLHVGCGPKQIDQTPFAGMGWHEVRLDIDASVSPDLIGTITSMDAVATASMDAVFSSHNIEHLYPDEVPLALAEFRRILRPSGFCLITCPDLQSICKRVAQDLLTEPAYTSPAGPIAAIDMLYGFRPALKAGNRYMAHRCGFTAKVLLSSLNAAGFKSTASVTRPEAFDLWVMATAEVWEDQALLAAAQQLFPN